MQRYFVEVAYRGTGYSGFQIQENAITVQSEVERALALVQRQALTLTGSSRTDAGVHALQNYFHFDVAVPLHPQLLYKANAILPRDLVIRDIFPVPAEAHARFSATGRRYQYRISRVRDPFLEGLAHHFPYRLDFELLQQTAAYIKEQTDFVAFAKTNSQVKHHGCTLFESNWQLEGSVLIYNVSGNRFLRGMVRLLTGAQLKVARGGMSVQAFEESFRKGDKVGISAPACGLYLTAVLYPENLIASRGVGFGGF